MKSLSLLAGRTVLDNFSCLLSSVDFLFRINSFENSFKNTIIVPNSLDSDQARRCVGPDLVPNCLERLPADDTCR